jgi:hypothetical protein
MKLTKMLAFAAITLLVANAVLAADAPKPTADQQAMMDKMMKAATPGAPHEMLKKMAGEWSCTVKYKMDPAQDWQQATSTATVTALMDGRYIQEVATGEMMGQPFNGMGLYGYDNVLGKYVSSWVDNMGTGIMQSQGTADASGKVINWNGVMSDPLTGKLAKSRMVMTVVDDDHHTFEMYGTPPGAKKEMKTMTIEYTRK